MSYNKELNEDFAVFFFPLLRNSLVGVKNEFLFLLNEDLQGISRFCDCFLLLSDKHFLGENRIDLNGDLNGDFPNDAVTFCFFCNGDFSVTSLLFDVLLNGDVVTNETLRLFKSI